MEALGVQGQASLPAPTPSYRYSQRGGLTTRVSRLRLKDGGGFSMKGEGGSLWERLIVDLRGLGLRFAGLARFVTVVSARACVGGFLARLTPQ